MPLLPNYYSHAYEERVKSIERIPGGLVAYEYWDDTNEKLDIVVMDGYVSDGFPAYVLVQAMIQHGGITQEALESLDAEEPNNADAIECLKKYLAV
jgi:hypothetical protein